MLTKDVIESFEILISSINDELVREKKLIENYLAKNDFIKMAEQLRTMTEYNSLLEKINEIYNNSNGNVKRKSRKNIGKGRLIPFHEYMILLCDILYKAKTKLLVKEIEKILYNEFRSKFTNEDLKNTKGSRIPRWKNRLHWAKFKWKKAGYIKDGEKGYWELSDKGFNHYTFYKSEYQKSPSTKIWIST
jgi:hypothetical protein